MTKVAILDDEVIICEILQKQLKELEYDVVGYALDYQEAIVLLNKKMPDIFLLDINLGGFPSGKDFAAYIRANVAIPLIFVSSYSDRQTLNNVKEVVPDGYLVKPFAKDDLFTAIEIAVNKFNHRQFEKKKKVESFFVKQNKLFVKVHINDICYIKMDSVYVELHTVNKKYIHRETLRNMLEMLPEYFVQIHRSYVVNSQAIEAVNNECVIIQGETLPVSSSFEKELFQRLNLT